MVLTGHLNKDELADLQLASDEQKLRAELAALADWAGVAAERPEHCWQRQRVQIQGQIAKHGRRFTTGRLAWAAALALVLVAGIMLNSASAPLQPQSQVAIDPDHDLLIAVDQAVASGGPEALEPAALLAREMAQESQPISSSKEKKESGHEN